MRHEMLTQCAPFCIGVMAKKGTLSQHFVTLLCQRWVVKSWRNFHMWSAPLARNHLSMSM